MKNGCGRRFRKRVEVQQKIAHSQSTHPSGENLRNSHVKHQACLEGRVLWFITPFELPYFFKTT